MFAGRLHNILIFTEWINCVIYAALALWQKVCFVYSNVLVVCCVTNWYFHREIIFILYSSVCIIDVSNLQDLFIILYSSIVSDPNKFLKLILNFLLWKMAVEQTKGETDNNLFSWIQINRHYFTTFPGILKIIELVSIFLKIFCTNRCFY